MLSNFSKGKRNLVVLSTMTTEETVLQLLVMAMGKMIIMSGDVYYSYHAMGPPFKNNILYWWPDLTWMHKNKDTKWLANSFWYKKYISEKQYVRNFHIWMSTYEQQIPWFKYHLIWTWLVESTSYNCFFMNHEQEDTCWFLCYQVEDDINPACQLLNS